MDEFSLILLGIAVVIGIPILAIASIIMVVGLRGRVTRLEDEVRRLRNDQPAPLAQSREEKEVTPFQSPIEGIPPAATPPVMLEPPSVEPEPASPSEEPEAKPGIEEPEPALVIDGPGVPPSTRPGLEEALGTRWAVWVGGIALALGGLFLVRYSIEAGLIGPELRIFAGLLFSIGLIGFGEWLRRKETPETLAGVPSAHIPGIVTAAGTVALFGTIYAAYALYDFIGPLTTFLALGLVGIATMAAAALHGPWLAGLGLVGAYGAPLLVASDEPNTTALVIYLAVVTASAFFLARIRQWRWLAVAATLGATAWGFVIAVLGPAAVPAAHVAILSALVLAILIYDAHRLVEEARGFDKLGIAASACVAALAVFTAFAGNSDGASVAAGLIAAAGMVYCAQRFTAVTPLAGIAAAIACGLALVWPVESQSLVEPIMVVPGYGPFAPALPEAATRYLLVFAGAGIGLFGWMVQTLLARPERYWQPSVALALAGTVGPLILLATVYYRLTGFLPSLPYGAAALGLAAACAFASEALQKHHGDSAGAASGIFAAGSAAALGMALTMTLTGATLTLAFALVALGVAYVATKRDLTALRWTAAAATLLVLMRAGGPWGWLGELLDQVPGWDEIAMRHGLPAIALFAGGWFLRRTRSDTPAAILDGASILLGAIAAALSVRRVVLGPDATMYGWPTLLEMGLFGSILFAATVGFVRNALTTNSIVHRLAAQVGTVGSIGFGVAFMMIAFNPAFSGLAIGGGILLNSLLAAYLVPAILTVLLALGWQKIAGTNHPLLSGMAKPLVLAAGAYAVISGFLWLTFETRLLVRGADVPWFDIETTESYAYSAVWLVYGIGLLVAGFLLRSQPARLASAVVILITVAKVFLLDMSGLEGVLRALSFIGLGLVLIGIGLVYQRFVFGRKKSS